MRADSSTRGRRAACWLRRAVVAAILCATPCAAQLATDVGAGQAFAGRVAAGSEVDAWRFDGLAGATFSARVVAKGKTNALRPDLALRDLTTGDLLPVELKGLGKRSVRVKSIELPSTGRYELAVTGLDASVGDYSAKSKLRVPKTLRRFDQTADVLAGETFDTAFEALPGSELKGRVQRLPKSAEGTPQVVALSGPLDSGPIDPFLTPKTSSVAFAGVPLLELGAYALTAGFADEVAGTLRVRGTIRRPKFPKGVVGEASTEALLSLSAFPPTLAFDVLGESAELSVAGSTPFAAFDLGGAAFGTTYLSSDEGVASVSTDGVVTAVGDGEATITITNGPGTAQVPVTVDAAPRLLRAAPRDGEGDVVLSRDVVLVFSATLDEATVDATSIDVTALGGQAVGAARHVSANGRRVTLFVDGLLPAATIVTVTLDGELLRTTSGEAVDVDGDGLPGGVATIAFTTVSDAPVLGTSLCLRVFQSTPDDVSAPPIAGAVVAVEGTDLSGVTDAMGDVRLEPLPAGRVALLIDGGPEYPETKVLVDLRPGEETVADDVFLTFVPDVALTPVADQPVNVVQPGVLSIAGQAALLYPGDALFADDLVFGGSVGLFPAFPERLPRPLPTGLDFPYAIAVRTTPNGGNLAPTNFDVPVPVFAPSASDAVTLSPVAPGSRSALWRFDEDTGRWTIDGPLVAGPDGEVFLSPDGTGLTQPGLFAPFDGALLSADVVIDDAAFDCDPALVDLLDVTPDAALDAALAAQSATLVTATDACAGDACLLAFDTRALVAHLPGDVDPRAIVAALLEDPNAFAADATFDGLAAFAWRPPANPTAPLLGDLVDVTTPDGTVTWAITDVALDDADAPGFTLTTVDVDGQAPGFGASRRFAALRVADGVVALTLTGAEARADGEPARAALATSGETWEALLDGAAQRLAATFSALVVDRAADVVVTAGLPICPPPVTTPTPASDSLWIRVDTLRAASGATSPAPLVEQDLADASASIPLPGDASYVVTAYDPVAKRHGVIAGTTPAGGQRLDLSLALAFDDLTSVVDSDGDGLGDVPETIVGTDPEVFDTDGDGLGDGLEVENGGDPFDGLGDDLGLVGSATTNDTALDVDARGGLLAVADGTGGAALFNVFAGAPPLALGSVAPLGDAAVAVSLGDGLLAIGETPDRLRLVDVSDPTSPQPLAGAIVPGTPRAVEVVGTRAFVVTDAGAVVALDADGVGVAATATLDEPLHDVVATGDALFVLGDTTLFVLSLDGACLSRRGESSAPGGSATARSLFVGGGVAYATTDDGYVTLDVADPDKPILVDTVVTGTTGWRDLAVDEFGRGVVIAAGNVSTLDVAAPLGFPSATYATPGAAEAVVFWAGRALVADGTGGVQVLADAPLDGAGVAPSVALATEAVVSPGRLVSVRADAVDDVRVRDVVFAVDGVDIATDGTFPFELHLRLAPDETVTVTARATDTGGASTTSAPVVIAALGAPTVDDPVLAHDADGVVSRVDAPTGCTTILGDVGLPLWDLATAPDGTLFALGVLGETLYVLDPETLAPTTIGPTGSSDLLNSLTFDGDTLWAAGDDVLATLDPLTGAATIVADLGGRQSAGDVALALDGRLLLTTTGAEVVAVDTSTFEVETIATLPTFEVYALARTPSGVLTGITASNQLLTIDEVTGVVTEGPFLSAGDALSFIGGAAAPPSMR